MTQVRIRFHSYVLYYVSPHCMQLLQCAEMRHTDCALLLDVLRDDNVMRVWGRLLPKQQAAEDC